DTHVITRSGFWRRITTVVRYDRVQTVHSSQTIFQRRRALASVLVDTAGSGGFAGGDAVALDLDAATADQLREAVAERLQSALSRQESGLRPSRR
ncbi:MAG: PH domain-containing protein, partial [Salinirussus sp.]